MGGASRNAPVVAVVVALLLSTTLLTSVQAQSGSVSIDVSSFGVEDYATLTEDALSFTFELHERSGQESNVSVDVSLHTMEGALLSNQTLTVSSLMALEERNLTASVNNLPYGYSQLTVALDGDVGTNTSAYASSITRVIQRLRPLNISLGGQASVTVQGVDDLGQSTGNTSLHDGDFAKFDFPVVNQGDVDWRGTISFIFNNGVEQQTTSHTDLEVNASSSVILSVMSSFQLVEGPLDWQLSIASNTSNAAGVHHLQGQFVVGPPPLPLVDVMLSSNVEEVVAGGDLLVNIEMWNNGSAAMSGFLVCSNDDGVQYNASTALAVGASGNETFTLSAKPMQISCTIDWERVDNASNLPGLLHIDLPSAVFESAGASTPTYAGGPWHKGDILHANLLMRNTGDLEGQLRLVLEMDGVQSQGEWLTLGEGSAGEVTASAQVLTEGEVMVSWWLESNDGLVLNSGGQTSFMVASQQSVALEITNITLEESGEVSFVLNLHLDAGKDREVSLQVGYETGDSTIYLQEQTLMLEEGLYEQTIRFGTSNGEKIIAQISAVDWVIGPGPLSVSQSIPSEVTEYWIEFGAVTSPLRPIQGDQTTVTLTFHQSGPESSAVGDVWIVDAYGSILASQQSPDWSESTSEMVVDIEWPKGSTVALRAIWHIDGLVITEDTSYISGEQVVESSFEWPVGAFAWGVMLGLAVVLGLRLKFRTASKDTKPRRSTSNNSIPASAQRTDEKREVSCPECERRLRVPVTYNGSVGCPDCSTKFRVEPPADEAPDQPEPEPEPTKEKKVRSDGKLEIACPDCGQSLRIPSSYTGSVRCPACTKIFKANEGVTILE